jgi:hypothetical protein
MDPLEIGRVSTSLPNAASLSWPASDEMLDHDDADGGTRATRTSTAATHNGALAEPHMLKSFDLADPLANRRQKAQAAGGPSRRRRRRERTTADGESPQTYCREAEWGNGRSFKVRQCVTSHCVAVPVSDFELRVLHSSAENVRWSPAEDARLRAAVFACSGIGPATNSSVPINLGTSEWPVVKRVFDSLALTEFAATATPRSVAALRAHFDSVLSPKINKPLTSPRRLDLDQARPCPLRDHRSRSRRLGRALPAWSRPRLLFQVFQSRPPRPKLKLQQRQHRFSGLFRKSQPA